MQKMMKRMGATMRPGKKGKSGKKGGRVTGPPGAMPAGLGMPGFPGGMPGGVPGSLPGAPGGFKGFN
jgi:hypothetical protein